ncbi:dihydropteroate synthase [Corynebacterium pelargi]|uniref:Dihydropteroate synthase n=1 Tax=Corynebacterium pelargi TaxID=1471400 RepID=A0A410W6F4_9CORY|nr:dihydropteroate synthase [Corynebacterium pelargi]QAU51621.1 Dihydropteroate synthase 1 [Corynebacterium pelargi]GGG80092.1 dihydropteroate synthase [Corynebacterium pelargi]
MRSQVMGIVNVTEDSFSDGGRYLDPEKAVAHAHELIAEGADIIDVGGESTRPGATRVDPDVELRRVVPVIRALSQEGIATSVDTMRASVAAAAVEAGVGMINDVSGGLADPEMLAVMADSAVPVCLMHWNTSRFGDAAGAADHGGDVVRDVHQRLDERIEAALAAGVRNEDIVLDPGLGFAKTAKDNWTLLHALPSFVDREHRILLGASRKRFLAAIRAERGLAHDPDPATAAVTAIAAQHGVWCVRVHDVAISRDAVDVAASWNFPGDHDG